MMSLTVETRVSIALLTLAHWPTVVIPLEVALTNVCAWTFVVLPTLNVIVVASAARISKLLPDAGSVDLGYPTWDEVTAPTLTVIVVPVTALIARTPLLRPEVLVDARSVERGYGWRELWLSASQVNS